MTSVRRTDRVAIADSHRTPAGVLIVPASLSRTGLQTYRTADGKSHVEFRPEQEVFSAEALASVRGAAVTVGHTHERTPRAVGLASDQPPMRTKRDGEDFVETSLLITDQETAARIERKDLTEISLDYYAELDPTPGRLADGREYHGVQRNIRVHSVALLPTGQARAGREARIRLDGNEELCNEQHTASNADATETQPVAVKIKIDGHTFDEGGPEHIAYLEGQTKRERDRADALQAQLTAAQTSAATEKARADGLAATPAPDVASLVSAELAFRDSVKGLLPADYQFAGKSRAQVKRDAVGADACRRADAQPELVREAYLDGALAFALEQKKNGTPAYPLATSPAPTQDAQTSWVQSLDARFQKPGAAAAGGSK